ncbi:uncharacterized protein B0I36DRAFT_94901 [Microdochium trichocladiopsis]|uniref:Dipeptidyl-peptidase V n=1 Tax=Microdochium trichocladiopsis TaxID=1682393 RepID=A0A9P8YCX2_9PEZI|nr:uncharacterized protein B0I36DRAFT_94901 [Microdochium trichocladiopsis]KAH7035635.1 hypothetical protein B0I36DRAFT_94901 [Microdochium trichocladiopsis]
MLVEKLTPELLVSTPRRSPAVPCHDGSLAHYTQTTHEVGGVTRKEIRIINIETSNSWVAVDDEKAHDATWFDQDGRHCIVYLKGGELGMTWIMFKDVDRLSDPAVVLGPIPGFTRDLKLKRLRDGSVGIAVVGLTNSDGSLHNPELEKKRLHTARAFESCRTRQWNSCTTSRRLAVWYSSIERDGAFWRLAQPFKNAMRNTDLDLAVPNDNPEPSGFDSYDISERGIVFVASNPSSQDPVRHGLQATVYYTPLYSYTSQHGLDILELRVRSVSPGTCSQPKFNKDGTMIGFIHAPVQCPEDRQIYIKHVHEPSLNAISVSDMVTGHGDQWQSSLVDFCFSPNGHSMYLTARECGRVALFKLELQPHARPRSLLTSSHGSCHGVYPLHADDNERVLVTTSSFVENSLYQVVLVDGPDVEPMPVSSLSRHGAGLGLSRSQVSEIYFEGGEGSRGGDYFCQAHVVRPRDFDPKRHKYPVAILVHDGPTAAWDNCWDTQWNAAVWAEQGYLVVLPNVSGSTGFGLEFSSAVRDSWGGRPFDDLVNLFQHLKQLPGTDMNNAVIAGTGYGGYMMNWIQGQDFGRKFKAIVSHAGVFDVPSYALTSSNQSHGPFSMQFGSFSMPISVESPLLPGSFPAPSPRPQSQLSSQLQYNPEGLERYNPARPDLIFPYMPSGENETWTTPMLLLHGERDHQVPVTESLAAFRVCQSRRPASASAPQLNGRGNDSGLQRHNTTASSGGGGSAYSSGLSHSRHLSMITLPQQHGREPGSLPSSARGTSFDLPPHQHHQHSQRHPHLHPRRPPPKPRSRLVLFPAEGHTIESPENLLEWYRQVFAWTNRWTGITARQAFRDFAGPATTTTTATVTTSAPVTTGVAGGGDGGGGDGGDAAIGITTRPHGTDPAAAAAPSHVHSYQPDNTTRTEADNDLIDMSGLGINYPNIAAYTSSSSYNNINDGTGDLLWTAQPAPRRPGSRGGGPRGEENDAAGASASVAGRVSAAAARPLSMLASLPSSSSPLSFAFR